MYNEVPTLNYEYCTLTAFCSRAYHKWMNSLAFVTKEMTLLEKDERIVTDMRTTVILDKQSSLVELDLHCVSKTSLFLYLVIRKLDSIRDV